MSEILKFELSGLDPTPKLADEIIDHGYDEHKDETKKEKYPRQRISGKRIVFAAIAAVPEESVEGSDQDQLRRDSRVDTGNLTDYTAKFLTLN